MAAAQARARLRLGPVEAAGAAGVEELLAPAVDVAEHLLPVADQLGVLTAT